MKTTITDHIARGEKLLSTDPNNELLISFLIQLNKLKNLPEHHLKGMNTTISNVLKYIKNGENDIVSKYFLPIFEAWIKSIESLPKSVDPNAVNNEN